MRMSIFPVPSSAFPTSGSGRSKKAKMRSLAFMPFMPMWKKLPRMRIGRKNSAASRMNMSTPARESSPLAKRAKADTMPTAAPP